MRSIPAVTALVLAALLAPACSPTPPAKVEHYEDKLRQLHGRSIDEVKRAWGVPARESELTSGGRMVKFRRMMPTYLAPKPCETEFEIDRAGIIVGHLFSGAGCRVRADNDLGLELR